MAGLESASLTIGKPGRIGAPGRIRTSTVPLLRWLPLPFGPRAHGVRGEIRTRNNAALNRTRLPICATRTLVGSQGFEPWMFPEGLPGLQPSAFSLSANCPDAICQRSGGRQATRTPMSRGTLALAGQWDTNYPGLPNAS
jgi:hypothetical protein